MTRLRNQAMALLALLPPAGCSGSVVEQTADEGDDGTDEAASACRAITDRAACCEHQVDPEGEGIFPCNWAGPNDGAPRCIRRHHEDCAHGAAACPAGVTCVIAEQSCDYTSYASVTIGVCM
jgi:hypothetical protein